jgi:hypothetical protein
MPSWSASRARLIAFFFAHFFHLLLFLTAGAQWACAAWLAYVLGGRSLPLGAHVLGAAAVYACDRIVVGFRGGRGRRPLNPFLRVYTASAFISIFCALFLLASGAVWLLLHGVVGTLGAATLPLDAPAGLGGGLDGAFRWLVSGGMGSIALTMVYGYVIGQRRLAVTETGIALRGCGRGLRVAQVSDVHVGQNLDLAQLETFVARVNGLDPDLICVTGDIADSPQADYATFFPVLGRLRARFGVYAILGNHDHYAGADRVVAELRRWTRIRVLRDEGLTIDAGGARLHLIGLDDRGRDWARGVVSCARLAELVERAPVGVPIVLLSHRPDIFPQAAGLGIGLTLAGHTHGGQIALPWFGGRRRNLAEFVTRFDRGLHRRGDAHLYVNCGLGVTGQRIRLFTPREITLLRVDPA